MKKNLRPLTFWFESYLQWFAVTGISSAVSLILALVIGQWLSAVMSLSVAVAIGLGVGGALTGLVQLALLRPAIKSNFVWILGTILGWTLGLGFMALASDATGLAIHGPFAAALGGLTLASIQWLAMASGDGQRGSWALVTLVGWSMAMVLGLAITGDGRINFLPLALDTIIVAWTLGWTILAILALVALPTLFPRAEKRESDARIRWW